MAYERAKDTIQMCRAHISEGNAVEKNRRRLAILLDLKKEKEEKQKNMDAEELLKLVGYECDG